MSGSSPRRVFGRVIEAAVAGAWDDLVELYAPDVVIEMPFAPAGMPDRMDGRGGMRERLAAFDAKRQFDKAERVVVHETTDPEVIVAEYELHGHATETGQTFVVPYVMVVRVRDGRIVASRDYSNPSAMIEALGI